jgi:hypothetical protein
MLGAQEFILNNDNRIEVNKTSYITLKSSNGSLLEEVQVQGRFMHAFLVGKESISIQTSDYSYTLDTKTLKVLERLEIPSELKSTVYFYYFKYDSLIFEITFSSNFYSVKYYEDKSHPLKQVSSSYRQDLAKQHRNNQAVWDIKNKIFYFNFPSSSEFYTIDLGKNKMKNVRASSKLAMATIEGIYWYADSKNDQVYLFGASTKKQVGKLFSFPDGLPEPKETWISGGVKMSRDDTTWEDHNLLVDKIAYLPRYVHNGKWVK